MNEQVRNEIKTLLNKHIADLALYGLICRYMAEFCVYQLSTVTGIPEQDLMEYYAALSKELVTDASEDGLEELLEFQTEQLTEFFEYVFSSDPSKEIGDRIKEEHPSIFLSQKKDSN